MRLSFMTLFPEMLRPILGASLLGKAAEKGLIQVEIIQIRDFAADKHRTVDDTPYGGGEGMLIKADVLYDAWKSIPGAESATTILMSPQGLLLDQTRAKAMAALPALHLILVCGHYEGIDERFIDLCVDEEISIGDYVLTGGELPALVVADSIARLLPGVLGNDQSAARDSLEDGLLKYPQYTKPRSVQGLEVPEVLLDGNHGRIAAWRRSEQLARTERKRPDLWAKLPAAIKTPRK